MVALARRLHLPLQRTHLVVLLLFGDYRCFFVVVLVVGVVGELAHGLAMAV